MAAFLVELVETAWLWVKLTTVPSWTPVLAVNETLGTSIQLQCSALCRILWKLADFALFALLLKDENGKVYMQGSLLKTP